MRNVLASLGMWLTRRFSSVRSGGDLSVSEIETFLLSRGWVKREPESCEIYDQMFVWAKSTNSEYGECWSLALERELIGNPWESILDGRDEPHEVTASTEAKP